MVTIARRNRSPWVWIVLAGVGLLVIGGLWLASPRVLASSPQDGLTGAANDTIISVTFGRPMDPASVQGHFSVRPTVPGRFVWQGDEMQFVPSQPWPDGSKVQVSLSSGALSRLFLPLLEGRDWTFEVGAPRLIYAALSQGGAQLFDRDLSDAAGEVLTKAPRGVLDYAVASETGDLIYLTSAVKGGQAVHRVDVRSGEDEFLMDCPSEGCRHLQLSPDGAWLTLEAQSGPSGSPTGPGEVWAAPTDGSRSPFRFGERSHDLRNALWSADSKLAVYDATGQAMLVFASPPDFQLVAKIPNKLGEMGAWSSDGKYLVYPEIVFVNQTATPGPTSSGAPDFYSHIFRFDIATGGVTDMSGHEGGLIEDASPAYSPDGKWIAFARKSLEPARWTLGRQLWLMRSDGSQSRPLTSQPVMNYATFAWRPDSARLVYVQSDQADPSRPPELGWLDVITGQTHALLVGGYAPKWIP
jgi:Tol biopolymer transport system component